MSQKNNKLTLELMIISGKILASSLIESKNSIQEGITTLELDSIIERVITSYGAKPSFKGYNGYPNASCISVNEQIVHSIPSKQRINSGDVITVDVGVSYEGNHTDAARTFLVGDNDEAESLLYTAHRALDAGISVAVSDNRVGDISYAIQQVLEARNYRTPLELGGHAIGSHPHIPPIIPNYGVPHTGDVLFSGMCLAIEPIVMGGDNKIKVSDDGWTVFSPTNTMSVHVEDTIVVTEKSPIILTREDFSNTIV